MMDIFNKISGIGNPMKMLTGLFSNSAGGILGTVLSFIGLGDDDDEPEAENEGGGIFDLDLF